MGTYVYELPTTGSVSFANFCSDQTPGNAHAAHISEATQARANLRAALKESKRSDDDEKDHLRLVKIVEEYLPHLLGIMACVSAGEITLKAEPIFSWRTTLSATLFNTSPRLPFPSLNTDLAFSLLTYAFALSNLAHSTVLSLGNYEHERGLSDAQRKRQDEKLNLAATLLCRASGVFVFLADKVLAVWEGASPEQVSKSRPPDLDPDVSNALAKLALADAQTLAIRKLLTRSAYDVAVMPGPPLPNSHPAPGLIAKLHLECAALYTGARALLGDVCAEMRRYIADEGAFHAALAHKWLGVDAGETVGSSGGGEAVAWLAWAKHELDELKGRSMLVGKDKKKRGKVAEESERVGVFHKYYKKINDSLTFQPVPTQAALQARIPAGRLAVLAKPYTRPIPAFGPGSLEDTRRKAETLDLDDDDDETRGKQSDETSLYPGRGSFTESYC